jgi:adenosine deaminase
MFVTSLEKAELHRHLELCVRPSTIKELAPKAGIDLPDEEAFRRRFLIAGPMQDLQAVLGKFLDTQKLWSDAETIERLTFEACEDAFKIDNVRILELRYAPTFICMNHPNLDFDRAHEAILKGVARAEKTFPMVVGLICILQRILPVADSVKVVDFVLANRETFVGLDLADNEAGFDSKPFAPLFDKARAAGLGITIHSGEAPVKNAARYVREAIEVLGATRIGHGVQIYRDESVMQFVRDRGVVLELCPTSNLLTQAVPSVSEHPFRRLMEFGIRTTINTDDPGIFGIDLTHEYRILHEELALSVADLQRCADVAATASFIKVDKRQKVWPRKLV